MDIETLLKELNAPQREAVETLTGPLLVLAGAGSGKTRVLTYRMANLIIQGEATPGQILAVTFTNKASREMGHRIQSLLQRMGIPLHEPLWISTFHSSCARLLRDEIHHFGYSPHFVIYDDGDQLSLIKKISEDIGLDDKVYPPKNFRHQISQAKMLALDPTEVRHYDGHSRKKFSAGRDSFHMDEVAIEIYQTYEDEMKRANALDFDDLLLKTYQLFKTYPEVLARYRQKFNFIMVDEYQDTNHIQYLIIKMLAEEHRNLCVVGDEDQSIYSWRGADIKNILDFEVDFKEARVVKLEENYRSTRNIVEAASQVIANNTQRKNKVLYTSNEEGSKIHIQAEGNEYDEARFVVRKVQDLMRTGRYGYNDMAVFYRTNAQSRVLEEQLRSYGIPYRLIGSVKFYERKEIKDVICYMRMILNPKDDVAFYRVVNNPTRGIGKSTLDEVGTYAFERKLSAFDAAYEVATQRLVHAGACNKLQNFRHLIEKLREESLGKLTPSEIYLKILEVTQYDFKLKEERTPESEARLENLQEFQNAILQFEEEREDEATLQAFLEEMALISDADALNENTEAVTLMTFHLSKGLEFKNVFMVGLEEGLFPSGRALDDAAGDQLEEERRICYVGMTRARENLFLSYAKTRRVYGQEEHRPVSRFIGEIPEKYITANAAIKRPAFLDRYTEKYGSSEGRNNNYSGGSANFGGARSRNEQLFPNYEDDFSESSFGARPAEMSFDAPTASASGSFQRGDRVRHPIFGVGSIFQVEGSGDQQKVSVLFNDKSLKKFMVKSARLERV